MMADIVPDVSSTPSQIGAILGASLVMLSGAFTYLLVRIVRSELRR